jgi:ubiquinone biosynthesis UbiH/UbiF/VisC/COQ6 family hydroxylase
MSREFDVLVVGAGVIGAVAARLLAARSLTAPARIALISEEPAGMPGGRPSADWDLRVYALGRAAERVLRECGVWDTLPADRVFAYERMCVWDASGEAGGRGSLCFDCAEIGEGNLGSIVDARVLQERCLQAAHAAGIAMIGGSVRGIEFTPGGARVALADGREFAATLLIGADGTESSVRRLAGIATAGHAYDQHALVAHVRTEHGNRRTAWQRFLPTGPFALLPLPDGRVSIVWSTSRTEAARLRALPSPEFDAELTAASGSVLGRCATLTPIAAFPLVLQYAMNYVAPGLVLLGDAAHVVHPLAGLGLNLGLQDCEALVEELAAARAAPSFGDLAVLRRYERRRRSENLLAAAALDGLERLFSNTDPLLTRLRSFGLERIAGVPFVRRQLARRALGV